MTARAGLTTLLLVPAFVFADAGWAAAQEAREIREVCASCHEGIDRSKERALVHADSVTCLTCHHVGFTNDPVEAEAARLAACASCHEDLQPAHATAEGTTAEGGERPDCAACHSVHDDPPLARADIPAARCTACHEDPHRLHAGIDTSANDPPACAACHTVHSGEIAHDGDVEVARACVSCHEEAHPSHATHVTGDGATPECTRCHSLAPDATTDLVDLDAPSTCAACHEDVRPAHAGVDPAEAPACADCHSFADDPALPAATLAIASRCGDCHEEAMADFRDGGHAEGMAASDPNGDLPTCLTCHGAHEDGPPDPARMRLAATIRCVECHSDALLAERYDLPANAAESYMDDFHGATVRFLWDHPAGEGQPDVMTCSDCHGAHRVGWSDEAAVSDVCARCHDGDGVKLASAWLGHTPVGPRTQPVIWLVRLFYWVLIPFALGGLALNIAFHLVDQRRRGARIMDTEGVKRIRAWLARRPLPKRETVQRFTRLERLEHFGSMTTFILLVITGLPQTRPDLDIARGIIGVFGGIGTTRLIHRILGFAFVTLMVLHLGRAVVRALRERRLPVMVPTKEDFRATLETMKHYLWNTPRPRVGKFDFSEKYEYWGLLLGGTLMSVTGIVLVFPELVTQWVPGVVVAAFRTAHGLEATFAVLVVAIWHSWGVIFRPEVFPLDTSIFTGRISVERLKEEHALEYERLFGGDAEEVGAAGAAGPSPGGEGAATARP